MADKKVQVGLLTHEGGAHVTAYLQALASTEQCDKVFLVDPSGRWTGEARKRLGDKLAAVVRDHQQVLKNHKPQLALVTMEARLAPPVIDAALEAECHVFAEKPACVQAEDFAPLVKKADAKHRFLMLALANRTNPEIVAAQELMSNGSIGRLFGLEMHLIADQTRLTRPAYQKQWYAQKDRAGGGHLIWLGIHWLDLAMQLVDSSISEVSGFTTNIGRQPIDVEDSAVASFRFDNGALGTMTSGFYLDKGYHSHIKIWGSQGWIHIEPMQTRPLKWYSTNKDLEDKDRVGKIQVWDGSKEPRGYTPFVQEAVKAVAEESEPPISSAHSLRALETVFGIYRAAESGRVTKIGS